jgi:hypothetical protein
MQINSGNESILDDIDFLCDTNSTSYTTAAKIRNVNRWAYKATIAQANGNHRWQVDDTNLTTLPHLTTTLVDSQGDYTLPAGFLRVERVEVLDNNGDYHQLKPIDHRDIRGAYTEYEETDGLPKEYDLVGNSLILFPAPAAASVTTAAGLRVHILREIDIFTTSDTTQEPGFPEPFHRILSFGAAYDYLIARGDVNKAREFRQEAEMLLESLRNWSSQMGEEHIRIRPSHKTTTYL